VRRFAVLALAGAAIAMLIPTHAGSFTYGRLVGGQVRAALAYGSGFSWYPYPAKAGGTTAAGSRRTRLAPPGGVPVFS
jgi:hypothetical protein